MTVRDSHCSGSNLLSIFLAASQLPCSAIPFPNYLLNLQIVRISSLLVLPSKGRNQTHRDFSGEENQFLLLKLCDKLYFLQNAFMVISACYSIIVIIRDNKSQNTSLRNEWQGKNYRQQLLVMFPIISPTKWRKKWSIPVKKRQSQGMTGGLLDVCIFVKLGKSEPIKSWRGRRRQRE